MNLYKNCKIYSKQPEAKTILKSTFKPNARFPSGFIRSVIHQWMRHLSISVKFLNKMEGRFRSIFDKSMRAISRIRTSIYGIEH